MHSLRVKENTVCEMHLSVKCFLESGAAVRSLGTAFVAVGTCPVRNQCSCATNCKAGLFFALCILIYHNFTLSVDL